MENWKELSRKIVFEKYKRKIEEVIFQLPDGTIRDLYIKNEGKTACVLALTKDQKIILIEQFRPGPKKVFKEMPGGFIEDDEEPLEAIKREFLEETGYTGNFTFIKSYFADAYSTLERFAFIATDCEQIEESKEQSKLVLVNLDEFKDLLRNGEMREIEVGFLGLDYLSLL